MTQQATRQNVYPTATAAASTQQKAPLGEHWTLVHEWYMEKREPLQVWRQSLRRRMAHLAQMLNKSLADYPNEIVGRVEEVFQLAGNSTEG